MKQDLKKRFYAYVAQTYSNNDCWEWKGACRDGRYGVFRIDRKVYYAHRVAAWLAGLTANLNAPSRTAQYIKDFVLHMCDNVKCCNPAHLWMGNASDNQLDMHRKKRHPKQHAFMPSKPYQKRQAFTLGSGFKRAVSTYIEENGVTDTALCKLLGISRSTFYRWLKNPDAIIEIRHATKLRNILRW